jgi:hypothetical protein
MILTTVFLLIGFIILLPVFIVTGNSVIEAATIAVGPLKRSGASFGEETVTSCEDLVG